MRKAWFLVAGSLEMGDRMFVMVQAGIDVSRTLSLQDLAQAVLVYPVLVGLVCKAF